MLNRGVRSKVDCLNSDKKPGYAVVYSRVSDWNEDEGLCFLGSKLVLLSFYAWNYLITSIIIELS